MAGGLIAQGFSGLRDQRTYRTKFYDISVLVVNAPKGGEISIVPTLKKNALRDTKEHRPDFFREIVSTFE